VDDVKIGVLSHLTEFIEVLPISLRRSCLPDILKGLRDVENPKNWRHKHMLVEQLVTLCDLYDADYLHSHIYPVAKELMKDRVHEVRQSATQLLGMVLQRLTQITPDGYLPVLRDMRTEYASHKWWNFRQLYISQCRRFVVEQCISSEVFVSECLPNLLPLVADKVPNVRLALARAVRDILTYKDYFQTDKEQTVEQLESILHTLRSDTDRDVIYFAGGDVSSFVRPHPLGGDLRYRSLSQASEDLYHDAVETLDGGRPREEHEAWLRSWEEALSGPTLQMTGEIR
jgi:serine/threonine-protein phosphatase 4 regulatory subunit 1